MLDAYGLHELTWDACDERLGDILVASPADAGGFAAAEEAAESNGGIGSSDPVLFDRRVHDAA